MPAADVSTNSSTDGWYILEIQKMMYGFGDSKYSLKETAELVEKIVKEQLIQFLNALSEVAVKINSKKIGIKEFLVLLRHSPVKLRRFCTYLQASGFKDLAKEDDLPKDIMTEFSDLHTGNKKLNSALAFLQHLDPSCYLCNVADPSKPFLLPDDALKERNERIERMTLAMEKGQYIEYSQAKSTSFKRGQPSGKFQDWLLKDSPAPEVALSATAWSILSYFAYETIAQIVDLAFIVRRDNMAGQVSDAVQRNTAPRVSPANADLFKPTWSNSMKPLQTAEVSEAIRRFNNTHNSIFSPFRRNGVPPPGHRLLAL
ncbi:transcription initiation protein SPT3 homolog [Daphnia pulex]|uniref:transcription initiation protein SPT3 homolog n=1 Tax=Daphnia pulex TaxID=6669 RepID=UPI001EDED9C2|nr:transcription initiation protein SPT3 homolog [Daphnia pulex]